MNTAKIGTPERLIRAAQAELIQGGGLLEMQAVARRAKVSVGLAYHHFGSKAGLIAAVVQSFYDRLEEVAFNPSIAQFSSSPPATSFTPPPTSLTTTPSDSTLNRKNSPSSSTEPTSTPRRGH